MRDLHGYGKDQPKIEWPNGAKLAISLVVNFEEGAEFSVEQGDDHNERMSEVVSVVPLRCQYPCDPFVTVGLLFNFQINKP